MTEKEDLHTYKSISFPVTSIGLSFNAVSATQPLIFSDVISCKGRRRGLFWRVFYDVTIIGRSQSAARVFFVADCEWIIYQSLSRYYFIHIIV